VVGVRERVETEELGVEHAEEGGGVREGLGGGRE
jgi:hypothetical protein